jgi:1,4-alpha-glucan branching enzyme
MPKPTSKKSVKAAAPKAAPKTFESVQPVVAPKPAEPIATAKPAAAPAATAAPKPPTPQTKKTVFALKAPEARFVSVCGQFNGWQPEAAPMTRRADGTWETSLTLRPGRYQYKFVVDGNWIHDPTAKVNVPNEHQSLNSVIEIHA